MVYKILFNSVIEFFALLVSDRFDGWLKINSTRSREKTFKNILGIFAIILGFKNIVAAVNCRS